MNTIFGAVFDHSKETPGLGAEINTDWFEASFQGKKIFDEAGEFVSIEVVKGGTSPDTILMVWMAFLEEQSLPKHWKKCFLIILKAM